MRALRTCVCLLGLVPGVLPGCCPSFERLPVLDEAGAPASVLDEVEEAIRTFAGWTGRDGVCVPGIALVDEVDEEGDRGLYQTPILPIRVQADAEPVGEVVLHELCHALDFDEGIVADHRVPFAAEAGRVTTFDEDAERFAEICAEGPPPVGELAVLEACGIQSPFGALLRDVVFTGYADDPVTIAGPVTLREVGSPLLDGEGVVGLGSWEDELLFVVVRADYGHDLVRYDPIAGTSARIGVPDAVYGSSRVELVPGAPPSLWVDGQLYTLDPATDTLVPTPLPDLGDDVEDIVVAGDRVLYTDADHTALFAASLDDGAPIDLPHAPAPAWSWLVGVAGGRVVGEGRVADDTVLFTWDVAADAWATHDLPDRLVGDNGGAALADGRVARLDTLDLSPWPRPFEIGPLVAADAAGVQVLLVHDLDGGTTVHLSCTGDAPHLSNLAGAGGRLWTWDAGALHEVVLP